MLQLLLYSSLSVFAFGLVYKVHAWFTRKIGAFSQDIPTSRRASAAARGMLLTVLSAKALTLAKVFLLDVLLQRRILKEDLLRWVMHMLIFGGFMMLLLMHALGQVLTVFLFPDYASALNPFFFLRSLFAAMALAGIGLALYRRFIAGTPRLKTNGADRYAIVILAAVMISGIWLEGAKITSYTEFKGMAEDYAGLSGDWQGEEEFRALETYWARNFGVVSPHVKGRADPKILAQGKEVHEMNCAGCHSSPKWAFTGYASAKLMSPFALAFDRAGGASYLWFAHLLLCFIGLAYLPFSKMFHIFAAPVSLLANAVMEKGRSDPANILTRQVMELDACTHCGTCSLRCSAEMAYEALENAFILPSEKISILKKVAAGRTLREGELKAALEGIYLCTNCDRCTVVCPSGINLRELWLNAREELIQKYRPGPIVLSQLSFVRGLDREGQPGSDYLKPIEEARKAVSADFESEIGRRPLVFSSGREGRGQPIKANTYSYCFGCQNCTTVCPVVGCYDNPQEALGLLPHQIMWCLGSGLVEAAAGSGMIWNCATCYQCQEHCPQKVRITDLFYELKNWVVRNRNKAAPEALSDSEAA